MRAAFRVRARSGPIGSAAIRVRVRVRVRSGPTMSTALAVRLPVDTTFGSTTEEYHHQALGRRLWRVGGVSKAKALEGGVCVSGAQSFGGVAAGTGFGRQEWA